MSSHIKYIDLSYEQRGELEAVTRKPSSPQGLVQRCRIILMTADEKSVEDIEKELNTTRATVRKWKTRYLKYGFEGLFDNPRPGKERRKYDTNLKIEIVRFAKKVAKKATEAEAPEVRKKWSIRSLAEYLGLNRGIVQRTLKEAAVHLYKAGD